MEKTPKLRSFKKKNVLLLGASGGVANAFLLHLVKHRKSLHHLVLLDKSDAVLTNTCIDHKTLDYTFIQMDLTFPEKEQPYREILLKYQIEIVIDLTDIDTLPILELTDKAGVSYINTALNGETDILSEIFFDIYPRKETLNNAVHILCSGMNPGVVNMWVRYGIEKYGIPNEIIHFEYDTSVITSGWKPMMTWCLPEFLIESVKDPSGIALGCDNITHLYPNSLLHRKDLTDILSPILELDTYPKGFQVLHEECLSIAQKYNIPSQFMYAYNLQTMDWLVKTYEKKGDVDVEDLVLGDNVHEALEGADNIGVVLQYADKKVYYFNAAPNATAIGTNGTYSQVIVGVFSALFTLLFDDGLTKQAYFVEDLYDSYYQHYLFAHMQVQEYVFAKNRTVYTLEEYNPHITMQPTDSFEYFYL